MRFGDKRDAQIQAERLVREQAREDRQRQLFDAKLHRIHADEMYRTARALDWQANKWQQICRVLYWVFMLPLCIASIGAGYLLHLLIKKTYGQTAYWFLFAFLTLISYGVYIIIHILYAVGYGRQDA